jgi:hypothetical protein
LRDDLPELPTHYREKLQKDLTNIVKKKISKKQRLTPEEVEKVRTSFFNFFVGVFQEYEDFLIPT